VASKLSAFLAELKRRKVYRVGVVYVVVGLGTIAAAEGIFPALDLEWAQTLIVVLVLLGFPIALVLAWAYEVRPEGPRPVESTSPAVVDARGPDRQKSIVVLPFDNMSPDPGDAYFADGLTEEIITNLSYIRPLRVISRSSAMVLKGTPKDVRTIGRELDVGYVLEGSVRKAGNDLRITAQLIDATTDAHLWAEQYDGVLDDVFDMQDKVSSSIVNALQLALSPDEKMPVGGRRIENVEAYESYLRARQEVFQWTPNALGRAMQHLQYAREIIGENPLVYSGMAYVYWQYVNMGLEHEEYISKAEHYAQKALELDPESAEAHMVLGVVFQAFRGDQTRAFKHLNRSLAVNPDEAHALAWLIVVHAVVGRANEAVPLAERLKQADPLSPLSHWDPLLLVFGGRLDWPLEDLLYWIRAEPQNLAAMNSAVWLLSLCGYTDQVHRVVEEHADPTMTDIYTALSLSFVHAFDGNLPELRDRITDDVKRTALRDPWWSYMVADIYALAGVTDEALDWLENALSRGWVNYPFTVQHDPLLVPLRDEKRFREIAERMKREWENFEV
jgi:non-specific serine/threonine protein kinase